MAPRKDNSGRRTPSSAPILAPTKTSYRVKRKPASPLPAGNVLNSPRYSPSPSPGSGSGRRMPGAFPRDPSKWMTKPLLPFRRVHQFRPYGVYLQFPGAGFLESRLRKKIEGEVLGVLRCRIRDLEAENERLRRDWTIQVELQDRGHGEEYVEEGGKKAEYFDQLRLLTGARDRRAVMHEVWRMEHLLDRAVEKGEGWKRKAESWKKRSRDVEARYADLKRQVEVLKAQLDALTSAEDGNEDDEDRDDEEEQMTRDLEAQFERDVAAPTPATINPGRILRSRGLRG
ncbi:MAG: hypothetical protein L6R38_003810 [Xanthoria sp. 2 TBL-2021]|nr:MAG: hypothetical protein L6R38_003810 [Xanthoria sp. 2 TBL-2021]